MKLSTGHKVYLAGLGVVGVVVGIATAVLGWSPYFYWVTVLGVLAGFGSLLANHFKVGWQPATAPCPHCQTRLHFLTKKQYLRCVGCEAMLQVQGHGLLPVDPHSLMVKPTFPVPLLPHAVFPPACALCGAAVASSEVVRHDKVERVGGLPGVVTTYRTTKLAIEVPVCAAHAGQNAVAIAVGDHPSVQHDGVSVLFRSLPAAEAYRRHNAAVMPPIANEPQMPYAPGASPGRP